MELAGRPQIVRHEDSRQFVALLECHRRDQSQSRELAGDVDANAVAGIIELQRVLAGETSAGHAHLDRADQPAVELAAGRSAISQQLVAVLVARVAGVALEIVVGQQVAAFPQLLAECLPTAERFQWQFPDLLGPDGELLAADEARRIHVDLCRGGR